MKACEVEVLVMRVCKFLRLVLHFFFSSFLCSSSLAWFWSRLSSGVLYYCVTLSICDAFWRLVLLMFSGS